MDNIKKIDKDTDFIKLSETIDSILNEELYEDGRDWTQNEIGLFVEQFNSFQADSEVAIDMNKLDPNFVPLSEFEAKYPGFDEKTIEALCKMENTKLEDLRIPPLKISNESVSLVDNLSNVIYNGSDESDSPKTESKTVGKSIGRGYNFGSEEEEAEEKAKVVSS